MPFCPECRYEYLSNAKTCPECKVDLVDQLDSGPPTETKDYVEIYMVSNRMEADVIESIFKENQVTYLIRDLRMFPVLPDFGRRVRLRIAVPGEQEQEGRRLLEEARTDGALTGQGSFL